MYKFLLALLLLPGLCWGNCVDRPRLGGFLDLEDCGYPKSGDVTAELQEILNVHLYGTIRVPAGEYKANIIVPTGVKFVGAGQKTIFKPADPSKPTLRVINPDVVIENLAIRDGNIFIGHTPENWRVVVNKVHITSKSASSNAITLNGANHVQVRNSFLAGYVTCDNCYSVKFSDNIFQDFNSDFAIQFRNGKGNKFVNNWMEWHNAMKVNSGVRVINSTGMIIRENKMSNVGTPNLMHVYTDSRETIINQNSIMGNIQIGENAKAVQVTQNSGLHNYHHVINAGAGTFFSHPDPAHHHMVERFDLKCHLHGNSQSVSNMCIEPPTLRFLFDDLGSYIGRGPDGVTTFEAYNDMRLKPGPGKSVIIENE